MKQGFQVPPDGWQRDDPAVYKTLSEISLLQKTPPVFSLSAPQLTVAADDDHPFRAWDAEIKVHGRKQPSWNQGAVGSCVSFGWGRGANDLIFILVARDLIEYPGQDVAT
jgi:hypothetical protein